MKSKGHIRRGIEQIARLKPKASAWSFLGLLLLAVLALVALRKPRPAIDADWTNAGMAIGKISLLDLPVSEYAVGFGDLWISKTLGNTQVFLRQQPCENYLFAHAPSRVVYDVPRGTLRFTSVGVHPSGDPNIVGSWAYIVTIDGKELFHSKALLDYPNLECPIEVDVPPGAKRIELIVDDLRNNFGDHAIWAEPTFEGRFAPAEIPQPVLPRSPIPLAP